MVLAFAVELGTFSAALDAWRVLVGHALVVILALVGCRAGLDPLALGAARGTTAGRRRTEWKCTDRLLPVIVAALTACWLAVSAWRSPVTRAGAEGILLLIALVFVVPAVAWLWRTPRRRRLGAASLGASLAIVATVALATAWGQGVLSEGGRAAQPLGHHNLLALWLVMLLPMALPGAWPEAERAGEPSGGSSPDPAVDRAPASSVSHLRQGRHGEAVARALSGAGAVLALVTVLATRSLGGMLALFVLAVAAVVWQPSGVSQPRVVASPDGWRGGRSRWRRMGAALLALGVLMLVSPRLIDMARGDDVSTRVRMGYLAAAVRGIEARPVLGWGPGAAHWTFAEHVRPIPGVHPAGEVVADPHSLPLRLAYDLGLPGLLLIVCLAVVVVRRRPELDGRLGAATGLGIVAFVTAGTFTRPFAALAVPVALAVVIGGRLAATQTLRASGGWGRHGSKHLEASHSGASHWSARLLLVVCAAALAPLDAARWAYDEATRAADSVDAEDALLRAVRRDPWHPLYRARLASLRGDAALATQAATDARGVAALWLAAGGMAIDSGTADERARSRALAHACRLDPLAPIAPFLLAVDVKDAQHPLAAQLGGRALLAEPLLLAAMSWQEVPGQLVPGLRDQAIAWVMARDDVDAGWRQVFLEEAAVRQAREEATMPNDAATALVVRADTEAATAMSLHVFQRRPWSWRLAAVSVDVDALAGLSMPAASALASTGRDAFDPLTCQDPNAW